MLLEHQLVILKMGKYKGIIRYLFCFSCMQYSFPWRVFLVVQLCLTLCDPMDCSPPGSSVPVDSPGNNTGVGCQAFFYGIFPTLGSNTGLPQFRQILYHLNHQGSPWVLKWLAYPFSRESSRPRNWNGVFCIAGRFFTSYQGSPGVNIVSVQFSSVAQSCLTLCDLMNRSTPGLPDHHQLPEFTQTHAHCVGDAIQLSHPLSSPSPALNPSQHQGLFQWVNSLHEVAKVLEFKFQHQSFQWTLGNEVVDAYSSLLISQTVWIKQQKYICHSLEARNTKIKVLDNLVPGENSLPSLQMVASMLWFHMFFP